MSAVREPQRGRRRLLAGLPLLATGLFLRPALADAGVHRASRSLMGTKVDLTLQADNPVRAAVAIEAAFAEMQRLAAMMNRFRPDSVVSALGAAAGREPRRVPAEMMAVLQMARRVSEHSQGNFDITVGAFREWGFDPAQTNIPTPRDIAEEIPLVDYRNLVLDNISGTAYLSRPGMGIDLGGIAKLPILNAGMQVLRRHGLGRAMLNGGGDVLVSGQLQGRDWRIGLRDPRSPQQLIGVLPLSEGWVAASGDYERCFVRDGRRYHHVLDPRTGMPSVGVHGVALVSHSLEAINGLGAAIMVAGAPAGKRWLAARPGVDGLIVADGAAPWLSSGLAARLQS